MRAVMQILVFTLSVTSLVISLFMLIKTKRMIEKSKNLEKENRGLLELIDEEIGAVKHKLEKPEAFKAIFETEILRSEVDRLKRQLQGDRVCDGYCDKCKHSFKAEIYGQNGWYSGYKCGLDCKCPDFEAGGDMGNGSV